MLQVFQPVIIHKRARESVDSLVHELVVSLPGDVNAVELVHGVQDVEVVEVGQRGGGGRRGIEHEKGGADAGVLETVGGGIGEVDGVGACVQSSG